MLIVLKVEIVCVRVKYALNADKKPILCEKWMCTFMRNAENYTLKKDKEISQNESNSVLIINGLDHLIATQYPLCGDTLWDNNTLFYIY